MAAASRRRWLLAIAYAKVTSLVVTSSGASCGWRSSSTSPTARESRSSDDTSSGANRTPTSTGTWVSRSLSASKARRRLACADSDSCGEAALFRGVWKEENGSTSVASPVRLPIPIVYEATITVSEPEAAWASCGLYSISLSSGCRSEEHTSELQSRQYLVCRLLLEIKMKK